jgi:hypothetical protein
MNRVKTTFSSIWLFCLFCILQKIRHYYQEQLHIYFLSDTTDNTIIIIVIQSTTNSLKVKTTIVGQGGTIPCENTWRDHALIGYNNGVHTIILDPSYGVNYGSGDTAKQNFINQLDSIGEITSTTTTIAGYGKIYTPTKKTNILKTDIVFSW